MDSQIPASAAPISSKNMGIEDTRRSVTYHPSIWGDYFLANTYDVTDILAHEEQERQRFKEEVKKLLVATPDYSLHKLDLIDAIQRLGIGYHFEIEIENSLKYIYDTYHESNDLRTCALRFRLLRQQGYYVCSGQLPLYMKHCFKALSDVYVEIAEELRKTCRWYGIHYVIKEMKNLVRAYFEEAKWAYNGYLPIDMEEYMKVALTSSGYIMLSTTCLVGMGELVTKEAFDWLSSESIAVKGSAIIARLMDDMAGHG
ncbi:Germacrene-D synthase [Forsythia ovata]|uniref:Germacrene-D synthase n=1 Tax=Forsythia ovata TaxID=205694 RepID=A0ABD1S198_9LAMI